MHESWADDYQRTQVFNNAAEEARYKEAQYDEFFRQVEKGEQDDFLMDLFAERVPKDTLIEYLGMWQNCAKEDRHKVRESIGGFIIRCFERPIEDAINDIEPEEY